jgi:multiple antibiotic resistance protein
MDGEFFMKVFGALFAIMNPFAGLPMFLSLTGGMDDATRRREALGVVLYSTILCAVTVVAGSSVLGFFGIGVADFRVAGGIVLLMIALALLNGGSSAHSGSADERAQQGALASVAFYPMAFPMVVGPGTLATLVVFAGQARSLGAWTALAVALAVVLGLLAAVLLFANTIGHHLSQTLRVVMVRLMGMILAAIAVGMIAEGLRQLFPVLGTATAGA